MERLTAWSDYGAYFPKCYEEPCDGNGTENDCDNCGFMDDVCRKLAQYEDIGTLEEVRDAVEKQMPKGPIYEGDGYFRLDWEIDRAMFEFEGTGICANFDNVSGYDCEVVGNIFDNPELLEVGE